MTSMSLTDKSVPVEYRYAFSTALIQLCYSNYFYQPMILYQIIITSRVYFMTSARVCCIIIIDSKIKRVGVHEAPFSGRHQSLLGSDFCSFMRLFVCLCMLMYTTTGVARRQISLVTFLGYDITIQVISIRASASYS